MNNKEKILRQIKQSHILGYHFNAVDTCEMLGIKQPRNAFMDLQREGLIKYENNVWYPTNKALEKLVKYNNNGSNLK